MTRPTAGSEIETLLSKGRAVLRAGDQDASREAFREAVSADPAVLHRPWGILPELEARGNARLRDRLIERRNSWHTGTPPAAVAELAKLVNKRKLHNWAAKSGVPVPRKIAVADSPGRLDWSSLPTDVVIKPDNAASNAGVVIAVDAIDRMTGEAIKGSLAEHVARRWQEDKVGSAQIIAEEVVRDIASDDPDTGIVIPRDFKVFAVRGVVGAVRVLDRNAPSGKRSRLTYDRSGNRIEDPMPDWPEANDVTPPKGFDAVVAEAERLSRLFPWLLRFDFYLSSDGPLLGEITTFPNAGLGFRGPMRRLLLQMWHLEPDPPRADRSDRPLIAVFTPGKVGGTAVTRAIRRAGLECFQFHTLSPELLKERLRESVEADRLPPIYISSAVALRPWMLGSDRSLRVITAVRDPVEQALSAFFENLYRRNDGLGATSDPDDLLAAWISSPGIWQGPNWVEEEFRQYLGIDLLALPFSPERRVAVYPDERLLVYRFDCDPMAKETAIREFVGRPVHPGTENRAQDKNYASVYAEVTARARIPAGLADRLYSSPFLRHFWTEAERSELCRYWTRAAAG